MVWLCNLTAFVVLIYLPASVNDFIIKNSKALLKAKLSLVATQRHYQQGKSLKAPANKGTSSAVWKDIKCYINALSPDYFLVEIWVKVYYWWICQVLYWEPMYLFLLRYFTGNLMGFAVISKLRMPKFNDCSMKEKREIKKNYAFILKFQNNIYMYIHLCVCVCIHVYKSMYWLFNLVHCEHQLKMNKIIW